VEQDRSHRRNLELQREEGQEVVGWLDTKAAATYAGTTAYALRKAVAERAIRFSQNGPGGKTWFRRSWIDQWREGGG
jgi:hypothetical protein